MGWRGFWGNCAFVGVFGGFAFVCKGFYVVGLLLFLIWLCVSMVYVLVSLCQTAVAGP